MLSTRIEMACLGVVLIALLLSGLDPHDRFTWWLEIAPILLGLVLVTLTWKRFPLSRLLVVLLTVHACILALGGHYTYALVPLGDWAREAFDLSRNHYDRVGHFAQGFIPAIVAREILLRRSPLEAGKWLFFIAVSICLAFSAFYELLEWWAALATGEAATAFLGTQGDPWDTQWDMFCCVIGAITSLVFLSALHDRSLAKVV